MLSLFPALLRKFDFLLTAGQINVTIGFLLGGYMGISSWKKTVSLGFALLAGAVSVHAATHLEGRIIGKGKQSGAYDLLVQVWGKPSEEAPAKLLQTIQIPKVDVVEGKFQIPLDLAPDSHLDKELSFKIQARPFETWTPFRDAEVSSLTTQPVAPGLVLR
jgi:hypothetical protein